MNSVVFMKKTTPWGTGLTLAQAFRETRLCQRHIHALATDLVRTSPDTPTAYRIATRPLPAVLGRFNRNIFSTLFHATYLLLNIPRPQRLLFGSLNQLFRIWVTSADNLLDGEDKLSLPLHMPDTAHVMRQVIAIMTADRVLMHLLNQAVINATVTREEAIALSDRTLQILLPSAAQEGSEEGGIDKRQPPDRVLTEIHPFKTGILFQIPFMGLEMLGGTIDLKRLTQLKTALTSIGLGCQLLDDVRDVARDWVEHRHNYVLSLLVEHNDPLLKQWAGRTITVTDRIYTEIPQTTRLVAQMGLQQIHSGLTILQDNGLKLGNSPHNMARVLLKVLDLHDLQNKLAP